MLLVQFIGMNSVSILNVMSMFAGWHLHQAVVLMTAINLYKHQWISISEYLSEGYYFVYSHLYWRRHEHPSVYGHPNQNRHSFEDLLQKSRTFIKKAREIKTIEIYCQPPGLNHENKFLKSWKNHGLNHDKKTTKNRRYLTPSFC